MTEIPDKHFFRPAEVARILEEPIRNVYYWLECDKILHVHHGRKTKIPREEIERLLREGIAG